MKKCDDMKFNVDEAIEYSNKCKIEEWVHIFLTTVGNNIAFSDGLKLQKRYWLGPVLCDLNKFNRCCGPEKNIKYHEPTENWDMRVGKMEESIRKGWDMPPLIVNHDNGQFELNDGNHRYEALIRAGISRYWVIFWDSTDNLSKVEKELSNE